MFFIGIFGVGNKEKKVMDIENLDCKNCELEDGNFLIKTYNYFHIFFIPIIKWNEEYFITCKGCKSVYQIPKDKGKGLEKGEKDILTYWNLKIVNRSTQKKCRQCNKKIDHSFEYCPYCGNRINE